MNCDHVNTAGDEMNSSQNNIQDTAHSQATNGSMQSLPSTGSAINQQYPSVSSSNVTAGAGSMQSLPSTGSAINQQYPSVSSSNVTAGAGSIRSVSQVGSNPSIANTASSIGSYQSIPGANQAGSPKSIHKSNASFGSKLFGRITRSRFSQSRVDSNHSVSTQHSSGSYIKVNIVTEAQSVLPSLTSAFSIEAIGIENSQDQVFPSSFTPLPDMRHKKELGDFEQGMSSSYKESLDVLDNPAYTDTVKSNDSNSSLLRRSVSVPSQYIYKSTPRRPMAQEVFEDFISKDKKSDVNKEDLEMEKAKGASSMEARGMQRSLSDLYENPDYIDSIQSTSSGAALLARTAVSITKDGRKIYTRTLPATKEDEEGIQIVQPGKYVKNLLVLSLSFMFIFTAYMSLRNLQSSINNDGGLALYALSTLYASLFVGCIFATTIVQRLRPKNSMLLAMGLFLCYIGANFYPTYYTLIPASSVVGFALAIMWTAHATYLTSIAANYAGMTGKNLSNIVSKFNGTFFMFFGMSQVIGGIISSTVLMAEPQHHDITHKITSGASNYSLIPFEVTELNITATESSGLGTDHKPVICGAAFCSSSMSGKVSVDVPDNLLFMLIGIYAGCTVLGIIITALFLDRLEGTMKKSHASLHEQLTAVFHWFWDWRVVCLLGMMFYTLVEMSFMFGEFTKAFVTCRYGVHMVGYAMLCLSSCSSVSSYINGKLVRYVGRMALFITAAVIHFALMCVMLRWRPTESSLPVMFVILGFWGMADSIWFTQIISLLGVLFVEKKEAAFAGLKMCQALGACLNFVTANYMCCQTKILILMSLLLVAISTYIFMELRLKFLDKQQQQHPITRPPPAT